MIHDPRATSAHTFHIPVMGTGFTIDTPLRVARYGIRSVISLVDDVLIEQLRRYHADRNGEPYEPIDARDEDSRAHRITAYLDLLHRLVDHQSRALREAPFEPGSEITRYFELLPDGPLRTHYCDFLACEPGARRDALEAALREAARPGSIDVNIMTKLNRERYRDGELLPPEHRDGTSALRGYANSLLCSAIVFSAGLNPQLYSYMTQFDDFLPDGDALPRKGIVLKVSDFRSALVQSRFLAKNGLWVGEFRIESGLNCGGHAFASKGELSGLILEEFSSRRAELHETMLALYEKGLRKHDRVLPSVPPAFEVTYQGGVGTAFEHRMLRERYGLDRTGWATPFMFVPEVTCVDDAHLERLCAAGSGDIYLSNASPMGIPFWNLRDSGSERSRRERIAAGKPGSACPKGFIRIDTEFTERPLCRASRAYQQLKLAALDRTEPDAARRAALREEVQAKSCICHHLGGGALAKYGIDRAVPPALCPGPGAAEFDRVLTLAELVGHIYGRGSVLANAVDRSHVFLREAALYVDYLRGQVEAHTAGIQPMTGDAFDAFAKAVQAGLDYCRAHAAELAGDGAADMTAGLDRLAADLQAIPPPA